MHRPGTPASQCSHNEARNNALGLLSSLCAQWQPQQRTRRPAASVRSPVGVPPPDFLADVHGSGAVLGRAVPVSFSGNRLGRTTLPAVVNAFFKRRHRLLGRLLRGAPCMLCPQGGRLTKMPLPAKKREGD
ncbi:hypothetical protein MRX96_047570 [Rhipicephalus microplus]